MKEKPEIRTPSRLPPATAYMHTPTKAILPSTHPAPRLNHFPPSPTHLMIQKSPARSSVSDMHILRPRGRTETLSRWSIHFFPLRHCLGSSERATECCEWNAPVVVARVSWLQSASAAFTSLDGTRTSSNKERKAILNVGKQRRGVNAMAK